MIQGGGEDGQQEREDLQTTHQHSERQYEFGEVGVGGEAAGRTDRIKAGADIVEAGDGGSEIGSKLKGSKEINRKAAMMQKKYRTK